MWDISTLQPLMPTATKTESPECFGSLLDLDNVGIFQLEAGVFEGIPATNDELKIDITDNPETQQPTTIADESDNVIVTRESGSICESKFKSFWTKRDKSDAKQYFVNYINLFEYV